jgi:7-cyano-7-deazaguanine synthase
MSQTKAVVVFSGGQDSTTCLYWALQRFDQVVAISINYGQRHVRELLAARTIAAMAGVGHKTINVGPGVLAGPSPLISDNTLEQYKDHASLPGGLEKTFVYMRNQLFLTIAASHACALGTNVLVTGVCEEDFGGYPDCRRDFIDAFEDAATLGTFTGEDGMLAGLHVLTPLMNLTKAKSVLLALNLPGCYSALAYSHTSYDGAYPPTGKDHATLLRAKGFEQACVPDPLVLRANKEGLMDLPDTVNYSADIVPFYLKEAGLV